MVLLTPEAPQQHTPTLDRCSFRVKPENVPILSEQIEYSAGIVENHTIDEKSARRDPSSRAHEALLTLHVSKTAMDAYENEQLVTRQMVASAIGKITGFTYQPFVDVDVPTRFDYDRNITRISMTNFREKLLSLDMNSQIANVKLCDAYTLTMKLAALGDDRVIRDRERTQRFTDLARSWQPE